MGWRNLSKAKKNERVILSLCERGSRYLDNINVVLRHSDKYYDEVTRYLMQFYESFYTLHIKFRSLYIAIGQRNMIYHSYITYICCMCVCRIHHHYWNFLYESCMVIDCQLLFLFSLPLSIIRLRF